MVGKITIRVPGRICVFGDKVDLLGKPVIAATIKKYMHFEAYKREDGIVKISSMEYPGEDSVFSIGDLKAKYGFTSHLRFCHACLKVLDQHSIEINEGFEVRMWTEIPIGSGLSTSAATSVGFLRCMDALFCLGLGTARIAEFAFQAEHDVLKIDCGRMDQYSIAFGGISFIETGDVPNVTSMKINKHLPLVIADSCEPREAKNILKRTKIEIEARNAAYINAFDAIYMTVVEGRKILENGCDLRRLGNLMNVHQAQENVMNASTAKLTRLCDIALRNGALGAKQMGAGGGGYMIALCPDSSVQAAVVAAINTDGGGKAEAIEITTRA